MQRRSVLRGLLALAGLPLARVTTRPGMDLPPPDLAYRDSELTDPAALAALAIGAAAIVYGV